MKNFTLPTTLACKTALKTKQDFATPPLEVQQGARMRVHFTLQAGLYSLLLLAGCQTQSQPQSLAPVLEKPVQLHTLGMDGSPSFPMTWTNETTGTTQTVQVTRVGDKLVYQGEVLSDWTSGDQLQAKAAIVTTRKWANNTVPYVINASSNTRAEVLKAVNYYNTKTNLRWVPRTNQTNYVEFINSDGCWSYVGRIAGKQQVSLGSNGCGLSGALHEMGHALGLHHEQSRPDRNQYVRVRLDLIPDSIEYNWAIESESRGFGSYDYYSIMHYGLYYNSQKVIEVINPSIDQTRIGNSQSLTATDISGVNYLYPITTTPPPVPSSQTFKGTLAQTGRSVYHSSSTGFSLKAGTVMGKLTGPANTDFDLFLQQSNAGTWTTVADSQSYTSSETITYSAKAGTYRWQVYSYGGVGSYTLVMQ
jgi:Astacin (Peptidase family M12A)/Bacterial pre-peptidase C-terminal domain